jgi:hypothetical protein
MPLMEESELKQNLRKIIKAYNYMKRETDKYPLDKIQERKAALGDIKQGLKGISIVFTPELTNDIIE